MSCEAEEAIAEAFPPGLYAEVALPPHALLGLCWGGAAAGEPGVRWVCVVSLQKPTHSPPCIIGWSA
jgi:hypothetical protein